MIKYTLLLIGLVCVSVGCGDSGSASTTETSSETTTATPTPSPVQVAVNVASALPVEIKTVANTAVETAATTESTEETTAAETVNATQSKSSKKGADLGSFESRAKAIEGLKWLNPYVGTWKGAGAERFGSTSGGWSEETAWIWEFDEGRADLVFDAPKGKFVKSGRFSAGKDPGSFNLVVTLANGKERRFVGTFKSSRKRYLILTTDTPVSNEELSQIQMTQVAGGARLLVQYRKPARNGSHTRMAEVGYTREGSGFGKGGSQQECVVTGGFGGGSITYKGKAYPVCCGGCRDMFNSDPEGVIAAWNKKNADKG